MQQEIQKQKDQKPAQQSVNIQKIMEEIRAEIREKGYTADMLSFSDVPLPVGLDEQCCRWGSFCSGGQQNAQAFLYRLAAPHQYRNQRDRETGAVQAVRFYRSANVRRPDRI